MNSHYVGDFKLFLNKVKPANFANEPYLRKKLFDYYLSKLIPDFYFESRLSFKYAPINVTNRYSITTLLVFALYGFNYACFKNQSQDVKKYNFNSYSKSFLAYERELIKAEKKNPNKIIL